jgi:hypothetical protein
MYVYSADYEFALIWSRWRRVRLQEDLTQGNIVVFLVCGGGGGGGARGGADG